MPDVLTMKGDVVEEEFHFSPDIEEALHANELAWENFQRYSGSYQRIRIAYVDVVRNRPEEFMKRLRHLIWMTEQYKQFGCGNEDYYQRECTANRSCETSVAVVKRSEVGLTLVPHPRTSNLKSESNIPQVRSELFYRMRLIFD